VGGQGDGFNGAIRREWQQQTAAQDSMPVERKFRLWPGLVYLLLGMNAGIVGVTMYFASADPSFFIEPDYYQKAVDWDQTIRQREANAQLGWTIEVTEAEDEHGGRGAWSAHIIDRSGNAVESANVEVTAFHSLRAAERHRETLVEAAPGHYASSKRLSMPGLWQFQFTVLRGHHRCTHSLEYHARGQREGSGE
jgi:nitrogen fixation protein FixH